MSEFIDPKRLSPEQRAAWEREIESGLAELSLLMASRGETE